MSPNVRRFARARISPSFVTQQLFAFLFVLVFSSATMFGATVVSDRAALTLERRHPVYVYGTLPPATAGKAYEAVFSGRHGSAPYYFALASGHLPSGLELGHKTGRISGAPQKAGTFSFIMLVVDNNGAGGRRAFTLVVKPPTHPLPPPSPTITVTLTPSSITIASAGTQQFTALVRGTSQTGVTWSASLGKISSSGVFTAPAVTVNSGATVTATSVADPTKNARATVSITAPTPGPTPGPSITTVSVPTATSGLAYAATLAASGGTLPYQWSVASGALPAGIQLNSAGTLSGTTSVQGQFSFTAKVADGAGKSTQKTLALQVSAAPPPPPPPPPSGTCGPPSYGCSRTDLQSAPVPNPPPSVGNLAGMNTIIIDPDFHNRVVRVTDANMVPGYKGTFVSASSGSADENLFNADSTLFIVQDTGTGGYPMTFDPATMQAGRMYVSSFPATAGMKLPSGGAWSRVNSNIFYQFNGTVVSKLDFTDRVNPPTPQQVLDFKSSPNCLGSAFQDTWDASAGLNYNDTVFASGFSNNGGQGGPGALYAVAFVLGKGCIMLNTQTGRVTGDWGQTGQVPNWTSMTSASGFTVHNAKLSKDGQWLIVTPTGSSCPACVGPYFWQIGTLNVTQPTTNTSGHWTEGYTHWINNSGDPFGQNNIRTFANPAISPAIIKAFPSGLVPPLDQHPSWNNADLNDTVPFFLSTAYTGTTTPLSTPAWWNEILGVSPTTGTVTRFAHSFITGQSQRFSTQWAIGSISQDGKFFILSSDWLGTLGSESGTANCSIGSDCRGDVFIIELK